MASRYRPCGALAAYALFSHNPSNSDIKRGREFLQKLPGYREFAMLGEAEDPDDPESSVSAASDSDKADSDKASDD